MGLKVLKEMPPWEWPEDTGKTLLGILLDDQAPEPDRVLAAELAGDYTVINDERTTEEAHAEHAGELPVLVVAFDEQILEALDSKNGSIHYEAVMAAGSWELDEAWPHVAALLDPKRTDKALLLAAIEAAASIRPGEAAHTLIGLTNSSDEDIVEAAYEAMAMVEHPEGEEDLDDDDVFGDDEDDWDERTR